MPEFDVVHKAQLSGRVTSVQMPKGAEVVHTAIQHGAATIWFQCDPNGEQETRYFQAFGTGLPRVPRNAIFCGTVLFDDGHLVYHIYEVFPPLEGAS